VTPTALIPNGVWDTLSWMAFWGGLLLGLALVPVVLFSRRSSQAKVAWILALLGFPWIGALFYGLLGRRRLQRQVLRLRGAAAASLVDVERRHRGSGVLPAPRAPGQATADLLSVADRSGSAPPVPGNEFTLLPEGPGAFAAAREAIEAARHHVHVMTYIFKRDATGLAVLRHLEEVARRGVEVRLLYDGLGSLEAIRDGTAWLDPLREAGGKCAAFLPIGAFRAGLRVNLRNHRKLTIVDGDVAFTGGMNIADEYRTGANWRDAACRIRGPAVPSLQRVFAQDWHTATNEVLGDEVYYHRVPEAGDVPVQVVESGPDQEDPLAEDLFFSALVSARRTIDLVTPYFVPTEALEHALRSAALRGRRVRILLGETVDHRVVRWATDAYLPRMIQTGIEVWRRPELVHGKVLVVDGAWATIGSTNFDARSLRLNFELNVAMPHVRTAERILAWFESELSHARRLTVEDLDAAWGTRLLRAGSYLLSPLL
jgi:cardiolipin synthase